MGVVVFTLGENIPGIKGNAIILYDRRIESALHVVNGLRDEIET